MLKKYSLLIIIFFFTFIVSISSAQEPTPTPPIDDPSVIYIETAKEILRRLFMMGNPVAPSPGSQPPGSYPVAPGSHSVLLQNGQSSLTADFINSQILAKYNSPAAGTGDTWVRLGIKYGIDPAYGLAFFVHESSAGSAQNWAGRRCAGTSKNPGNIKCAGYRSCCGAFRKYNTWEEGIEAWFELISRYYIKQRGLDTVEKIIPVYAPSEDSNNPQAYINFVNSIVARWRGS